MGLAHGVIEIQRTGRALPRPINRQTLFGRQEEGHRISRHQVPGHVLDSVPGRPAQCSRASSGLLIPIGAKRLTARWQIPPPTPASTPHPLIHILRIMRSDRSDLGFCRLKGRNRVRGIYLQLQGVARSNRLERPERPEMRGNARASLNLGFGVWNGFHALLGISGRSSRSGRIP